MRLRAKIDANQTEIVGQLRKAGFSVILLHQIGAGVPDLLLSDTESMWLVEVKVKRNKKGEPAKLTEDQEAWHKAWRGKPPIIATTFDEIYRKIKLS